MRPKEQVTNDELHFGENWFHGKLSGGREEAERYEKNLFIVQVQTFIPLFSNRFITSQSSYRLCNVFIAQFPSLLLFTACCDSIHIWATELFWFESPSHLSATIACRFGERTKPTIAGSCILFFDIAYRKPFLLTLKLFFFILVVHRLM